MLHDCCDCPKFLFPSCCSGQQHADADASTPPSARPPEASSVMSLSNACDGRRLVGSHCRCQRPDQWSLRCTTPLSLTPSIRGQSDDVSCCRASRTIAPLWLAERLGGWREGGRGYVDGWCCRSVVRPSVSGRGSQRRRSRRIGSASLFLSLSAHSTVTTQYVPTTPPPSTRPHPCRRSIRPSGLVASAPPPRSLTADVGEAGDHSRRHHHSTALQRDTANMQKLH